MDTQTLESSDHTRTNRTPAMECYCIDLLLDEEHGKNRMGNIFNKKPVPILDPPYNEKVLEGHYTNLWTQINDVKSLLHQNGFSWDDIKQMMAASHHVWDVYIKAHPKEQF